MPKNNILIIEDHALTRFGLKTAFEMTPKTDDSVIDWKIFEAPNARKGLDIADKEKIDIVIMVCLI